MENRIHPTAILEGSVDLGSGNVIGPYTTLVGPLTIGDENRIGPFASLGGAPDELSARPKMASGAIEIGSRCLIRDFVSVHKPFHGELTSIGDDVYLMHGSYVAHDATLYDKSTVAQSASIGGLCKIHEGAYIAMGAAVQQRTVVGGYSIVAAAAAAVRCVPPFSRYIPGQALGVNTYALERYGFDSDAAEIEAYVMKRRRPQSAWIAPLVDLYDHDRSAAGLSEY